MEELLKKLDCLMERPDRITGDRVSIINGAEDLTVYSEEILQHGEELVARYDSTQEKDAVRVSIIKIMLAEICYQRNDCFQALIMVNSALAFLDQGGNEEIWFVARYVQMCIMIVTGQLKAIYPLVEGMRERILLSGNERLVANYESLGAWVAMYDNNWDVVNSWMEKKAPSEYEKMEMGKILRFFVKARFYYLQGKNLALFAMLQSMEHTLQENHREMALCELNLLMAMALSAEGHPKEAGECLEKVLDMAAERKFIRLFADEGEPVYRLVRNFTGRDMDAKTAKFLKNVKKASQNMALLYPGYLRSHRQDQIRLTKRELEILELMADERSNGEIADFFGNSVNTIKTHMKSLFRKLGVTNREDAVRRAVEEQFIQKRN